MPGSPFNNEDMPFYLLALFLSPVTIYFKNGNNVRDTQFWINVVLFLGIFFRFFGHLVAIGHAWYYIYHHSNLTGNSGGSYLDRLQFSNEDDVDQGEEDSFDDDNQQIGNQQGAFSDHHQQVNATDATVPSYSDAIKQSDNKTQV